MQNFLKVSLFIVFLIQSTGSIAMDMFLSKDQIQGAVSLICPYPLNVGAWHITLDKPSIHLFKKTQSVSINTELSATEGKQFLLMTAQVKGELIFNAAKQELQVIHPMLDKLEIKKTNIPNADKVVKQISSGFGKSLPLIVLLNLDQLGLGNSLFKPQRIEIEHQGVVVSF